MKKDGASPIAAFDADGTLWSEDAGYMLLKYQIEKNLLPGLPKSFDEFLNEMKRESSYEQILSYMACINEGVSLELIRKWAKESLSLDLVSQFVFQPMKELISFLLERGVQIYIVTASLKWSVEPLAKYFGISVDHVLGVTNRVQDKVLTGELHLPLPWREGKLKVLLKKTKGKRPFLAAGNSINDKELIHSATHVKIAVSSAAKNKTNFESEQKLKNIGQKEGWEIFSFHVEKSTQTMN